MSDPLQPVEVPEDIVEKLAHLLAPMAFNRSVTGLGHQEFMEEDREARDGARLTARDILTTAATILTANLKQRIEELEGELADRDEQIAATRRELREFEHVEGEPIDDMAAVAVVSHGLLKHRAVSAEQRLEEARGAMVLATRDARRALHCIIGNALGPAEYHALKIRDGLEAAHAASFRTSLETPKQERDTEVRVEEEVEGDEEGCQKPDACEWNWWPDHCQCRSSEGKRADAPEPVQMVERNQRAAAEETNRREAAHAERRSIAAEAEELERQNRESNDRDLTAATVRAVKAQGIRDALAAQFPEVDDA